MSRPNAFPVRRTARRISGAAAPSRLPVSRERRRRAGSAARHRRGRRASDGFQCAAHGEISRSAQGVDRKACKRRARRSPRSSTRTAGRNLFRPQRDLVHQAREPRHRQDLGERDEIIVTDMDHDANISTWIALEEYRRQNPLVADARRSSPACRGSDAAAERAHAARRLHGHCAFDRHDRRCRGGRRARRTRRARNCSSTPCISARMG